MDKKKHFLSKKIMQVIIVLVLIFLVFFTARLYQKNKVPQSDCSYRTGSQIPASPSFEGSISAANVIVRGTQESASDDPAVKVEVNEVMKGQSVKVGDMLSVCPYAAKGTEQGKQMILFLEGKDDEYWVPTFKGSAQNMGDGKFRMQDSDETWNLERLRQVIR